ncbi:EpsG family protein [Capnocytophaga gingivalis]|uniref:EpsG family protein n=1 Tax=Capnocytophaga gingivalis TaxID=1017 RepID=UPI0028EF49C2|nr:EpsG family protein [Capnocytophaga gingivalis]
MQQILVKKSTISFLTISFFIALFVGNRGNTRDTIVYLTVFKNIDSLDLLNPIKFYLFTGMEIGFGWYCYIINLITHSHVILFTIFSLFTFLIIYLISKKLNATILSVLLLYISTGYFLLQQFMQIRQGLATPLALFAITVFIMDNNKFSIKFLLITLLAFSFHQIALPVILIGVLLSIILKKIDLSINEFKWISVFLFIIFIIIAKFLLVNLLTNISSRVEVYSNSSEYAENVGIFRLPNIKAFFTFLFILFLMNEKMYRNKLFTIFFLLFIVGVAFRIGFSDFAILSGRFATAFSFSEIFILPFAFYRFKYFNHIFLILFVIAQAVATYMFQAPFVMEDYFKPLSL